MIHFRRFSILLIIPFFWLPSLARPGRAQEASGRFAFADTTLLRDTLGLHFTRLFPLSDSLQITPDTLRALAIRYRYPLEQLVFLADSLQMPVDSVGPYFTRERYNVLSSVGQQARNNFRYTTGYTVGLATSSWTNNADWDYAKQALLLHSTTSIGLDRYQAGPYTQLHQNRSSQTEADWKVGPNVSLGGRADLQSYNNVDPTGVGNEASTTNRFDFTMNSRQRPGRTATSRVNFSSGLLSVTDSRQEKRGLSAQLNGHLQAARGTWLTNDLDGLLSGNTARTDLKLTGIQTNTNDRAADIHGTLSMFPQAPLGLNVGYAYKQSRVETPTDSGTIRPVDSRNNSLDATLKGRLDNDRYASVSGRLGNVQQVQGTGVSYQLGSESTSLSQAMSADGRYILGGWSLDGHFTLGNNDSRFPHRDASGGYQESYFSRSVDGTLTRSFGTRLVVKGNGNVSLLSYRYTSIGAYRTLPIDNDQYRQSYRLEGIYTPALVFNTGVALEVIRSLAINLPAASTASNNEDRTYRAEWRWTYRLLPMLTATQRNLLSADYVFYNYSPSNNRLLLDYSLVTALNAVLTPRLTLDLTHNSRVQPSGSYVTQATGSEAFGKADENKNYTLGVRVSYTPTPGLSLTLEPSYLSIARSGNVNGVVVPQRTSGTLNFSGGASVNVAVGQRGQLTGDIHRIFRDDRSTTYTGGVPVLSPLAETDYWSGGLTLTWAL
jgi:antitoxin component of MazEF toxin-antitoxin module